MSRIIKKGAEAILIREAWYGKDVVIKDRIPKAYRVSTLDLYLRRARTRQEAKLLTDARNIGVLTPFVFLVDLTNTRIVMEYIEGQQLKEAVTTMSAPERVTVFHSVGEIVGKLHLNNIVHGDLTTSNIILTPQNNLYFLDFGLGVTSSEIEQKGVDLHLLQRVLESTHYHVYDECLEAFLAGYQQSSPSEGRTVIERLWEIDSRGRYASRARKAGVEES